MQMGNHFVCRHNSTLCACVSKLHNRASHKPYVCSYFYHIACYIQHVCIQVEADLYGMPLWTKIQYIFIIIYNIYCVCVCVRVCVCMHARVRVCVFITKLTDVKMHSLHISFHLALGTGTEVSSWLL